MVEKAGSISQQEHQLVDETEKLQLGEGEIESEEDTPLTTTTTKKKKKRKTKKKSAPTSQPYLGKIQDEIPSPAPETKEERIKWENIFSRDKKTQTYSIPVWGLLNERNRPILDIFLTPSCRQLELVTPRLRLRQVAVNDHTGIRRIKMEPSVQKTQLFVIPRYGSPTLSSIKDFFQTRYLRSSIPRANVKNTFRDEYIFAITALDTNPPSSSIQIKPAGKISISNRIHNLEGYLGNIALHLEFESLPLSPELGPQKGIIFTQPTFEQTKKAKMSGRLFYEIHPQLWGQGIMSEAFSEILRFAFEEVGCTKVISDPTSANDASIALCIKNGLKYTKTTNDNPYNRPQLFHEISQVEWWKRNRPDHKEITDHWGGKQPCRWCMNVHLAPPTISCKCNWAKYCSRECQKADWSLTGGHQEECDA